MDNAHQPDITPSPPDSANQIEQPQSEGSIASGKLLHNNLISRKLKLHRHLHQLDQLRLWEDH